MALIPALLPVVLGAPMLWVILSLLYPRRAPLWLTAAGAVLQLAAAAALWWQVASHGAGLYYPLGGWQMPLGIGLRIDGLAVTFVLLTSVIGSVCALHGHLYLQHEHKLDLQRYFWPLFWFLWTGLNSIWLSADLFNLYVSLEVVGLCAVGLVAISGEPEALSAALRYLLAALSGSLAYLLGVGLIYGSYDSLSIPLLADTLEPGVTVSVALALMTVGLMFKTALFPLHGWLPSAHGTSLAPVSALLSGLVIKASFYVLARLWMDLGTGTVNIITAQGVGLLGAMAIFWGSWKAFRQHKLKMVVAYSTVAQIGYFFLFFPLVTEVSETAARLARDGAMLLVLAHALAKASLFLAAGTLIASLRSDTVEHLAGISRFRPISLLSFALASVTLMGLPPSGGFTAKWLLMQSAFASGQWHWMVVIVLGGLATAAYIYRVFHSSLREGPEDDVFAHPRKRMAVLPLILAVASILLGLLSAEPLRVLSVSAGVADSAEARP